MVKAGAIGMVCALWSLSAFDAAAATGDLTQKRGAAGCIAERAAAGCADGRGLGRAESVTVSPDGQNVYVASIGSGAVAVFDRGADGALEQKPGKSGCISDTGDGGCADGRALNGATVLAVSADGRSAYVVSVASSAVAVFDRAADGGLSQKRGRAGCVSRTGADGCADGKALDGAESVTVSPDGKSVYVAAGYSGAVAVFDRAADGRLTQKRGTAGCISNSGGGGCADGKALSGAISVTVSPDGKSAYVEVSTSDTIAVFDRDADGALKHKPGKLGCVAQRATRGCVSGPQPGGCVSGGTGGCLGGKPLPDAGADSVAVSRDGASAYIASLASESIAVFDRAADGKLMRKPGKAGCVADSNAGKCGSAKALAGVTAVEVSPDGKNVYASSSVDPAGSGELAGAVAVFDRESGGRGVLLWVLLAAALLFVLLAGGLSWWRLARRR